MQDKANILIKVCGMRDAENITAVAGLHPDYMGFIFYPASRRFVGPDFTMPVLPSSIKKVGVFVNEKVHVIFELAKRHHLDLVQLHGEETSEECRMIQKKGMGVIKVFQVEDQLNFLRMNEYKDSVDYFLFDTKSVGYGGSGKVFDWTLLHQYDQEVPFFLSGGLRSSNIDKLGQLKNMNLHGIDLNSGIEDSPGIKNAGELKKIQEYLTAN